MVMLLMLLIVRSEYDDDDDVVADLKVKVLKMMLLIEAVKVLMMLKTKY